MYLVQEQILLLDVENNQICKTEIAVVSVWYCIVDIALILYLVHCLITSCSLVFVTGKNGI